MLKILIPVDGSALSMDAVRHGLGLVHEGLRATFVLANVQEPASLYEMVTARDPDVLADVSEGAGEHLLAPAVALFAAAGVPCECDIALGEPVNALIDMVERHGCDAVIICAHGKGAVLGALVGSVSQALVHACPVPVTVVKSLMLEAEEAGDAAGLVSAGAS